MSEATPLKTVLRGMAATALVGGALGLAGCGSGDSDSGGSTLNLDITDAPVDSAQEVVVRFDGVEVRPANGETKTFSFDSPKEIDLLQLQGEESLSLLEGQSLEAGKYTQIRLQVTASESQTTSDSYIKINGSKHSLFIPSASKSGLKLVRNFDVPENGSADFTVDFDLRQSVHDPEGARHDYILRPTLRLIDNTEVGHIAAEVKDLQNCGTQDGPAIYVYEGAESEVTPGDVAGADSETEPLTTARLEDDGDGTYTGKAGFLSAGDYTVAFTCQAGSDSNEADDDIGLQGTQELTVEADKGTTYSYTVGSS